MNARRVESARLTLTASALADGWWRELRWFARQPARIRALYLAAVARSGGEIPAAYRIRFEALAGERSA